MSVQYRWPFILWCSHNVRTLVWMFWSNHYGINPGQAWTKSLPHYLFALKFMSSPWSLIIKLCKHDCPKKKIRNTCIRAHTCTPTHTCMCAPSCRILEEKEVQEEVQLLHPLYPDCILHTLTSHDTHDLHARRVSVTLECFQQSRLLTWISLEK